ncbi:MAG: hypothetical protein ACOCWR_07355, partial [Oceanidesulfovibrio sp.]
PEMVLAKPVQREDGMVLLAEDTELTSTLIKRLETMDVEHIVVKGNPVDMDGLLATTSTTAEDLDRLFRKHTENAFMMKLKAHLAEYFQVKAAARAADMMQAEDDEDAS